MLHGKLFFFGGAATAGVAPVLGALDLVGWLRTRHFLLFFFLTGATWQLVDSLGRLRTRHFLTFFFFDGCYMAACR